MTLRVLNWSSYQSYKDRKPPWIRFHRTMLDNFEYHSMSANARALLPMLWLLASEDDDPVSGLIRIGYEKISFRLRLKLGDVKTGVEECIASGFVEETQACNESVTNPLQNRTQTVTPETETETETESSRVQVNAMPDWIPLQVWNDYLEMRKRKKAPATERAKELIIKKLDDWRGKGHDVTAILEKSITSNWTDVFEPKQEPLFSQKPEPVRTMRKNVTML